MSEPTPEREIEVVTGTIEGVIQKKPDTWQVEVRPDGSQYTKKLWTKDKELVDAMGAKFGQAGAFVCGPSYWDGPNGKVRSLWINAEGAEAVANAPVSDSPATQAPAQASTPPRAQNASDAMTKEEWARKDRAADLRACIAIAAGALQHTVKSEPADVDLNEFARRTLFVARQFHGVVTAERTGEDAVPFLSAHDEEIPY